MSQPGMERSETPGKSGITNNWHAESVQQNRPVSGCRNAPCRLRSRANHVLTAAGRRDELTTIPPTRRWRGDGTTPWMAF